MSEGYDVFTTVLAELGVLFVAAFVIERILDFVFDYHFIRLWLADRKGVKAPITVLCGITACTVGEWDIFAVLMNSTSHIAGQLSTGIFVAGGSGAIMTLFHNVLGLSHSLRRERRNAQKMEAAAKKELLEIEISRATHERRRVQQANRNFPLIL